MNWITNITIILAAFMFMEFVAWFAHKYIMHGVGWLLHKDHHMQTGKTFEFNDLFALIFALPSIVLIILGSTGGFDYRFMIGAGIALYGFSYFLFHDVLVHKRLHLFHDINNKYFKAVISAHLDHHRGKKNYGFLFMFPWKYFKKENQLNTREFSY